VFLRLAKVRFRGYAATTWIVSPTCLATICYLSMAAAAPEEPGGRQRQQRQGGYAEVDVQIDNTTGGGGRVRLPRPH
jgi:hypothetical protein